MKTESLRQILVIQLRSVRLMGKAHLELGPGRKSIESRFEIKKLIQFPAEERRSVACVVIDTCTLAEMRHRCSVQALFHRASYDLTMLTEEMFCRQIFSESNPGDPRSRPVRFVIKLQ
ncbi:MAG: hypothetical protein R3E09_02805 [Novosphingobium sp.]